MTNTFGYTAMFTVQCSGQNWDIQIFRYSDIGIFRYSDIGIFRYSDIGIFRYSDM